MLNVVLVEPEIPQNCGNIARTCAATGARLHLVKPLGFDVSDSAVKRAGLDYWHLVEVTVYDGLSDLFARRPEAAADCWLATTKAPRDYTKAVFRDNCWLFFGKETAGLPEDFRMAHFDRCVRLPIRAEARSLNLSNSVAVIVFEALRQLDFPGLLHTGEMADNALASPPWGRWHERSECRRGSLEAGIERGEPSQSLRDSSPRGGAK